MALSKGIYATTSLEKEEHTTNRCLLVLENLSVAVLASLLVYVSFSAMDQDFGMDTLNDDHPRQVHAHISAIAAGLGLIVLILSLGGLYGSLRRSKSVLSMYGAIILFLVAILGVLVLLTFTMRTNVVYREVDRSIVNSTVQLYNHTDPSEIRTRFMDHIQRQLSCCGINSPNDWTEYGLKRIPRSCCQQHVESLLPGSVSWGSSSAGSAPPSSAPVPPATKFKHCEQSDHKLGCWRAVTDYFHSNLATARLLLYATIGDGLLCSLAAFLMVRTLRRSLEVV